MRAASNSKSKSVSDPGEPRLDPRVPLDAPRPSRRRRPSGSKLSKPAPSTHNSPTARFYQSPLCAKKGDDPAPPGEQGQIDPKQMKGAMLRKGRFAPIASDRVRGEDQLSGFFRRLGGRAHGPWSREAPERTFLVAGVAGIKQVFAAVRLSDSMNWAARDPRASRQSDDDRISIS